MKKFNLKVLIILFFFLLLGQLGFAKGVQIPVNKLYNFVSGYQFLEERQFPIIVTSDVFLFYIHQATHIGIVKNEKLLSKDMKDLIERLLKITKGKFYSIVEVGAYLYGEDVKLKDDLVKKEIELIKKANGVTISPLLGYEIDYSKFKVRGYYKEEGLSNYFLTYTWFSEAGIPIAREYKGLIDSFINAIQDKKVKKTLNKMFSFYELLIKNPRDVTYRDIEKIGTNNIVAIKKYAKKYDRLRLGKNKAFIVLLPQFKTFDSYIMQHTVCPYIPKKYMPNGLEVASVLGIVPNVSDTYLNTYSKKYTNLDKTILKLKDEWSKYNNKDIYHTYLHLLSSIEPSKKTLIKDWDKKLLSTALSGWAMLKSDTLLYGEQSYTPKGISLFDSDEAIIEPLPSFYKSAIIYVDRLKKIGVNIEDLKTLLKFAYKVSEKELNREALTYKEIEKIKDIPKDLANITNKDAKVPLIVDIHKDMRSGNIKEIGIGPLELFTPQIWAKTYYGLSLSYRELISKERMDNQNWLKILKENKEYGIPKWRR